jgi:hypothetical protein
MGRRKSGELILVLCFAIDNTRGAHPESKNAACPTKYGVAIEYSAIEYRLIRRIVNS